MCGGLVGLGRELDAARLAPPARVHLRLHHDLPTETLRNGLRLGGRLRDVAVRYRDAVTLEDVASLVFVQVHACSGVMVVPASPRNAGRPWAKAAMMARRPPARTKSAAASTLGRMLPVPSSFPASR